jgi:hypothetical protein
MRADLDKTGLASRSQMGKRDCIDIQFAKAAIMPLVYGGQDIGIDRVNFLRKAT